MFRSQMNVFDELVAKATDENLTSENWEYIMDVCDKVSAEENGEKDAVLSMIKRLAHRNANVHLYTLELANSLTQNCGVKFHRELASRAFTDALLRLAADRNTHQQVKGKILERMEEWSDMFKDPDLGIMQEQYLELKSQNPHLQPPSAPSKSRLTEFDRQKEEEELQMALRLSIQSEKPEEITPAQQIGSSTQWSQPKTETSTTNPVPSGTTAATVSRVRALYDFQATDPDELTFSKGDIIAVLESVYKDWWKGLIRGETGIFPLNYVEKLADPTPEELQREAQTEAEVFAEIKNVEKLLTLLSTASPDMDIQDNDEIGKLYYSTLAIRPKLIELIGKYSQKKDEFTQLNERFIKSCREYENLLDASMTQNQSSYQPYRHPQGLGFSPPSSQLKEDSQINYTSNPIQEQNYLPHSSSAGQYAPPRTDSAPFYIIPPGSRAPSENGGQLYIHSKKDSTSHTSTGLMVDPTHLQATAPSNPYTSSQIQINQRPQNHEVIIHELPNQTSKISPPPSLTVGYPSVSQPLDSLDSMNSLNDRKTNSNNIAYKPYQPSELPKPLAPSAPPGNPADFYRSSATS